MDDRLNAQIKRTWPRQIAFTLIVVALIFVPAGTLAYWQGWAFLAVFLGCSVGLGIYFANHDPALLERRMKAGPAAEQEPAQKIIIALLLTVLMLLLVMAGFDHRWHGAVAPAWLVVLADFGVVVSFAVFFIVMKQNSYAASTIRVEQGQPVISTGLYGLVRHPMYTGALLLVVCMPLALGSYRALLAVVIAVPVLAWRLLDEERYLKLNLPGYAEYCVRVRYRLIPLIW
ncbi:MAG TPA: isoprenylcysteine carboxylmethyltransferase family protein [Xanthobacteraceae bacterium]|nr:isoprenylcysteine carboxylmethyltransferase family protein [Xanthobacteraceae bacterium]